MKVTRSFHGQVKGSQIILADPAGWERAKRALDGQPIEVNIMPRRNIRSLNQNSYFHGVICELISDSTGDEPAEVKEILKQMFLLVDDGKYPHCRPTSSLTTAEMARFMEQCIRWAAKTLELAIPDPTEVYV